MGWCGVVWWSKDMPVVICYELMVEGSERDQRAEANGAPQTQLMIAAYYHLWNEYYVSLIGGGISQGIYHCRCHYHYRCQSSSSWPGRGSWLHLSFTAREPNATNAV